ncbi:Galactokinase [Olavius algarvensis spirochete endosymbiont]|uniref:galactokinase n=1 Tax=Olavius algarvensis spirochete endosymbiont TaxID=260710 RepID=UPI000F2CB6E3|nr:galactokinase family protein [Olavius algarvensis spirochete endosymbiont]VDA99583.1 Galactokinase [Olavius algarvensis spirochete endosymbiont]
MAKSDFLEKFENIETIFNDIYSGEDGNFHLERWIRLTEFHENRYNDSSPRLFSAPGRTELSGNHTDHNGGVVLSAAIQMDTIAAVTREKGGGGNLVEIISEGYPPVNVNLSQLARVEAETGTSDALLRGIAASIVRRGGRIGGFRASTSSRVPKGSGLSSSAALEILIGSIFNELCNDGRFTPVELAQMGQEAEKNYFGKPCGLMDQISCSVGGALLIDFAQATTPDIHQVNFNPLAAGFTLAILDSGGNHADLTADYAAIPVEMRAVASVLGARYLGEVDERRFMSSIGEIRKKCGDRAILRALHFFNENRRVHSMVRSLERDDIEAYLEGMRQSGNSSFRFLQNVFPPGRIANQSLSLALALSESFLGESGAARVHGGGFAGTIQVLIPSSNYSQYKKFIEGYFGEGALIPLSIRRLPAGELR